MYYTSKTRQLTLIKFRVIVRKYRRVNKCGKINTNVLPVDGAQFGSQDSGEKTHSKNNKSAFNYPPSSVRPTGMIAIVNS